MSKNFLKIFLCLLIGSTALAQSSPSDLSYRKRKKGRTLTFSAAAGCSLFTNDSAELVSNFRVAKNGSALRLPKSENKKDFKISSISGLQKRYSWWACGSVEGILGLYARKNQSTDPVHVDVSYADFSDKPESQGVACARENSVVDGEGGWLHKPVSDSTQSIVNLFPTNVSPSNCGYYNSKGKKISGTYDYRRKNGNRVHVRPSKRGSCSTYPKNLTVRCKVKGQNWCWTVKDPCKRYD